MNRAGLLQSPLLRGLLLLLLVFVAYQPAMQGGFIWDDDLYLTANPLIRAPDGLARFWFSTEPVDYYPLSSTTLWLEWRLWAMDAMPYHVTNILLHGINTLLLVAVLRALRVAGRGALRLSSRRRRGRGLDRPAQEPAGARVLPRVAARVSARRRKG